MYVCICISCFAQPISGLIMRQFLRPCGQSMHFVCVLLLHARWRFAFDPFIYLYLHCKCLLSNCSRSLSRTRTYTLTLTLFYSPLSSLINCFSFYTHFCAHFPGSINLTNFTTLTILYTLFAEDKKSVLDISAYLFKTCNYFQIYELFTLIKV